MYPPLCPGVGNTVASLAVLSPVLRSYRVRAVCSVQFVQPITGLHTTNLKPGRLGGLSACWVLAFLY